MDMPGKWKKNFLLVFCINFLKRKKNTFHIEKLPTFFTKKKKKTRKYLYSASLNLMHKYKVHRRSSFYSLQKLFPSFPFIGHFRI